MKIVVVDDHPLARKGIISILQGNIRDCVISEATCVEGALNALKADAVAIMFVDLKLGVEDGLEIIRQGMEISPDTKFIIITTYIANEDLQKAERLDTSGYISKSAAPEDIVYIVDLVMRGKKYYDSDLISAIDMDTTENGTSMLTEREKEVLAALGKGLSNEEIGKQLFISVNTVKKHISNIMSKLNMEHRTQLILYVNNWHPHNNKE
jgi:two-component system nitrate/nitrite response regulator NarL